jgi:hypothetical protein
MKSLLCEKCRISEGEPVREFCDNCGALVCDGGSEAIRLLSALVGAYDAMPDGPLGRGLLNSDFLNAKDWLAKR